MSKKNRLHPDQSEPEFFGDLVYKFNKIMGRADFSDPFRKIIIRHKRSFLYKYCINSYFIGNYFLKCNKIKNKFNILQLISEYTLETYWL